MNKDNEDNTILKLDNVSIKNGSFMLNNICFTLKTGYIYAIAGKNGSGKSTLLKTILSMKKLKNGRITLFDKNVRENHLECMEQIGFVSEDRVFFGDLTANENALVLSELYCDFSKDIFYETMKKVGTPLGVKYDNMSRGEKVKFQISFAIAHKSKLLVMDEPTAGMDPVFRIEFFDLLRELLMDDCAVLMTSHNMDEIVKQTDYVAFMQEGSLSEFKESIEVV